MKKLILLIVSILIFNIGVSYSYTRNESINKKIDVYNEYIRKNKSFGDLLTDISADSGNKYDILFVGVTSNITANATLPTNVDQLIFDRGGAVDGSFLLTFSGQYINSPTNIKIFGDSLSLTGNISNSEIYTEWWGSIVDDSNSDSAAIARCFTYVKSTNGHKTIRFLPGQYDATTTIIDADYETDGDVSDVKLVGSNLGSIINRKSNITMISVKGRKLVSGSITVASLMGRWQYNNLRFEDEASGSNPLFDYDNAGIHYFDKLYIKDYEVVLDARFLQDSRFTSCYFKDTGSASDISFTLGKNSSDNNAPSNELVFDKCTFEGFKGTLFNVEDSVGSNPVNQIYWDRCKFESLGILANVPMFDIDYSTDLFMDNCVITAERDDNSIMTKLFDMLSAQNVYINNLKIEGIQSGASYTYLFNIKGDLTNNAQNIVIKNVDVFKNSIVTGNQGALVNFDDSVAAPNRIILKDFTFANYANDSDIPLVTSGNAFNDTAIFPLVPIELVDANGDDVALIWKNTGVTGNLFTNASPDEDGDIQLSIKNTAGDQCEVVFRKDRLRILEGDLQVSSSNRGVVLTSPDGNFWRIQVGNAGTLNVTGPL